MTREKKSIRKSNHENLSGKVKDTQSITSIPIFGREEPETAGGMGDRSFWFKRPVEMSYGREFVDAAVLKENILKLLASMQTLLDDTPRLPGTFNVESLTFSVEISAKGSVSLLGTGGEVAGSGGVTVTLKRSE